MGFEQWVDFFLENYSKPPIRADKTHNANMRASKHLKGAFQGCKLADLTADGIELYLRKRLRDRVRVKTTAGFIERDLKHISHNGPVSIRQCRDRADQRSSFFENEGPDARCMRRYRAFG
jgi:hypothetical protein